MTDPLQTARARKVMAALGHGWHMEVNWETGSPLVSATICSRAQGVTDYWCRHGATMYGAAAAVIAAAHADLCEDGS